MIDMIRVGQSRNLLRASSSLSEIWPRSAHHHPGQRRQSAARTGLTKVRTRSHVQKLRNSLQTERHPQKKVRRQVHPLRHLSLHYNALGGPTHSCPPRYPLRKKVSTTASLAKVWCKDPVLRITSSNLGSSVELAFAQTPWAFGDRWTPQLDRYRIPSRGPFACSIHGCYDEGDQLDVAFSQVPEHRRRNPRLAEAMPGAESPTGGCGGCGNGPPAVKINLRQYLLVSFRKLHSGNCRSDYRKALHGTRIPWRHPKDRIRHPATKPPFAHP